MYTLFICGAPSNSRGFEYAIIDGEALPDDIGQYIDIYDSEKMKEGRSYVVQKLKISKTNYTLIAEYVRINPSDQKTSRGSYIAVGILTKENVSLALAVEYLCIISSIHTLLKSKRNDRNAFDVDFSLDNALIPIENYYHIAFLADMVKDISKLNSKKIVFNDLTHNGKVKDINDNSLQNEYDQLKALVEKHKEELVHERDERRISDEDNNNMISILQEERTRLENRNHTLEEGIKNMHEKYILLQDERKKEKSHLRSNQSPMNRQEGSSLNRNHIPISGSKKRRSSSGKMKTINEGNSGFGKIIKYIIAVIILFSLYILYSLYPSLSLKFDTQTREPNVTISENSSNNNNNIGVPKYEDNIYSGDKNDTQETELVSMEKENLSSDDTTLEPEEDLAEEYENDEQAKASNLLEGKTISGNETDTPKLKKSITEKRRDVK